ncbi:MAG: alpha/beta hydrolase [Gemmatimonadota bacterium]|nr:alpha/beta hydrolase [Gemmatimonadota bacterium]MDH3367404.1 alpha/beta hydrolase [Gemmatimonadota bacterium]MDH5551333.1 alpha/beta hydrolase [Gemmatimonadota bacterium]
MTWRTGLLAIGLALVGVQTGQAQRTLEGEPPLHVVETGRGETVIVLHGGPGLPHTYLREAWDTLSSAYRLVYYDQRGCGRSGEAPSYTWRDHVQDIGRVIDAVAPGGPVILAGTSWGAMLALLYTYEHPAQVRALVLSSIPPWPVVARPGTIGAQGVDVGELPSHVRARLDSLLQGQPVGDLPRPDQVEPKSPRTDPHLYGLDSTSAAAFPPTCDRVFRDTNRSLRTVPPLDSLSGLRVPTLVVKGGGTLIPDGGSQVAQVLPRASFVVVPRAQHAPWFDHHRDFFAAVFAFLRKPH